jgi:hydrogenase/urease accessory protein HupE
MRLHPTRMAPLALLLSTPLAGWAHPGHDSAPALGFFEGLVHVLTQPDHLAMLAGGVVVAVLALRTLRARVRTRVRAR